VLGCAVAAELFQRFPGLSEGKLTRLRASLVREEALAELGRELGLPALLHLGEGEMLSAEAPRSSMVADAVEALFGALYLDGGYEAARKAVAAAFGSRFERLDPQLPAKDAKTQLQERLQAMHRPLPAYRIVEVRGAAHRQTFEVECRLDTGETAAGSGTSRQRAEQDAARVMLEKWAPQ
jgi:ribonuclease-3